MLFETGREMARSGACSKASCEVSYALRERRSKFHKVVIEVTEFNRTRGPDGSSEVSLDLKRSDVEHNEVRVPLEGENAKSRRALPQDL